MKRDKVLYNVYAVKRYDFGDGHIQSSCYFAGQTMAVSIKSAENNVRHNQASGNKNMMYSYISNYMWGDGAWELTYHAVQAAFDNGQIEKEYTYDNMYDKKEPVQMSIFDFGGEHGNP